MEIKIALLFIIGGIALGVFIALNGKKKWKTPKVVFPPQWRKILKDKIGFYNTLTPEEKKQFEFKVQEFLLNCDIIGVNTSVNKTDKILVAASAIIPVFAFPDWKYTNLQEVLIYPGSFDEKFNTEGDERQILGMVGSGYMEGKMILSKNALHIGFRNESDKKNTAIHEFVHLIDKADGQVDGVPELLLEKQYVLPWFDLIRKKIDEIVEGDSDINPYGSMNNQEFFAVVSEYFFERPTLLAQKHPVLYDYLSQIFNQEMHEKEIGVKKTANRRNAPCDCGSGKKYKHCCG